MHGADHDIVEGGDLATLNSIFSTSRRWIASSHWSRCIMNGPVERVPISTKSGCTTSRAHHVLAAQGITPFALERRSLHNSGSPTFLSGRLLKAESGESKSGGGRSCWPPDLSRSRKIRTAPVHWDLLGDAGGILRIGLCHRAVIDGLAAERTDAFAQVEDMRGRRLSSRHSPARSSTRHPGRRVCGVLGRVGHRVGIPGNVLACVGDLR